MLLIQLLAACCRDAPAPALVPPESGYVAEIDEVLRIQLADFVDLDTVDHWEVEADTGIDAEVLGEVLRIAAAPGFLGSGKVNLTAIGPCDQRDTIVLDVRFGPEGLGGDCATTFSYTPTGGSASIAGTFTDWQPLEMVAQEDGTFSITLDLEPGAWPYKLVDGDQWLCDPSADFAQCDADYSWDASCTPGAASCNSMVVVPDCAVPVAEVTRLQIDRQANAVEVEVGLDRAAGDMVATLNGEVVYDGPVEALSLSGLGDGRQTLRVTVEDSEGVPAEELYIPFWTDDRDWENGLMYYVFVDRFENGDASNDNSEGTNDWRTDYIGGDWQGVIDRLDYLDDLGVTVIWLTAPQDNAEGIWGDKCGANYTGYHGYWPSESFGVEEHFGTEATLRELIDAAHDRGMRVVTDWVANHVHEQHPWASEHPEWFNDELICQGDVWNTHPETCWFDPFLPDIDYSQTAPLTTAVDDAISWVKDYELDGYRVDAVKHMPHSVFFNFQSRVRNEIEHSVAGGDEDFYTVGETFSGDRDLLNAYIGPEQLDAQFDFGLYWSILGTIGRHEGSLRDLEATFDASEAAYGPALMSTFLGNHDVERFVAHSAFEVSSLYGDGACPEGSLRGPDQSPDWDEPYLRLKLAWTFLLTHEGLPLVYYGDEIGLPGYHDPDNRLPMRFEGLNGREAGVLAHVQALGQARAAHPALSTGARAQWWVEDDVLAWARVNGDSQTLVVINRSWDARTLSNGLAFAGLSEGTYTDVLTGQTVTSSGDSMSVTVPAMGSVVLVR